MSRSRRNYKTQTCYEICFRARNSLPLVAYKIIEFIIASALARTQRDDKVTLCHFIWNGSHPHLFVICRDAYLLEEFYKELQKKLTDAIKRLLGLNRLQLWEGRPHVAELPDVGSVKRQIAYLYANPAQDDLEDSIEKFPGYSSCWKDFRNAPPTLEASATTLVPWIRLPTIPKLPSDTLTESQDLGFVKLLTKRNQKIKHPLVRKPNAWMKCFGISEEKEIQATNDHIVELVRENEAVARKERELSKKSVLGARRLRSQPILKPHQPKKYYRRVFVITGDAELRLKIIQEHREFSKKCSFCYEQWKIGNFSVVWPPGAFRPPLPPARTK